MQRRPLNFLTLCRLAPGALSLSATAAAVAAFLSLATLWCIYQIAVVLWQPHPNTRAAWTLTQWTLAAIALRWLLMTVSHVAAHKGAFEMLHQLRLRLAKHLGGVPLSFFETRKTGSLRRTLADDVASLEGFLAHMLPDAIGAVAVLIVSLCLMFLVDWRLALAALLPLPFALGLQNVLLRRSRERLRAWAALQRQITDNVNEYVRGMHVVKSFGLSAQSFRDLAQAIRAAADWVAAIARTSAAGWIVFTALLSTNIVIVAPFGAWLRIRGELDVATYILFLIVAPAALAPLLRLTFAASEQAQRREALERINSILTTPELTTLAATRLPDEPLSVSFEHVYHSYQGRLALEDVSFLAQAGELTALVGPSGAGKTTVARLISRACDVERGFVRIGGLDVRDWPLDALLSRVAIVFQDVHLFHGTVLENLLLAKPSASQAEILAAARAARADDFIANLPRGYETLIGERGAQLSGGERQRLSIARALLKNAPVLVLDEATAFIDPENEFLIQQALAELCRGRTVLMIAHRLHTVSSAEQIVVMDAGRVVGTGKHDALLNTSVLYRRLWHDATTAREWRLAERFPSARECPAAGALR